MWARISAILSRFDAPGKVPRALQISVSVGGIIVVGIALTIFVNQSWGQEVSEGTILYTSLILLTGLAMVRSGTRARPESKPEDQSHDDRT